MNKKKGSQAIPEITRTFQRKVKLNEVVSMMDPRKIIDKK